MGSKVFLLFFQHLYDLVIIDKNIVTYISSYSNDQLNLKNIKMRYDDEIYDFTTCYTKLTSLCSFVRLHALIKNQ